MLTVPIEILVQIDNKAFEAEVFDRLKTGFSSFRYDFDACNNNTRSRNS